MDSIDYINKKVYKILTRNDTGETHSHQSGITIPVNVARFGIFPEMTTKKLNPRETILFFDEEGKGWEFQYIYYNDLYFGKPKSKAHDEHRLTCVRNYIVENQIKSGDSIWFLIDENGVRHIGFERLNNEFINVNNEEDEIVIKLGRGWRCIKI